MLQFLISVLKEHTLKYLLYPHILEYCIVKRDQRSSSPICSASISTRIYLFSESVILVLINVRINAGGRLVLGRTDNEIKNIQNTHLKKRLEPQSDGPMHSSSSTVPTFSVLSLSKSLVMQNSHLDHDFQLLSSYSPNDYG